MYVDMCVDMCVAMYVDRWVDMCVGMCWIRTLGSAVIGHKSCIQDYTQDYTAAGLQGCRVAGVLGYIDAVDAGIQEYIDVSHGYGIQRH